MPSKLKNKSVKTTISVPSNLNNHGARFFKRRSPLAGVWGFIIWLVGILVSLAVGFGMVDGTLKVWFLPVVITAAAGWIVVVLMLIGVLLKVIDVMS